MIRIFSVLAITLFLDSNAVASGEQELELT